MSRVLIRNGYYCRRDGTAGSQIITAIGETVNACARLESLTKKYGCAVIVSRRSRP